MRDEGMGGAYNALNLPRHADLEMAEASFARLYKAARRLADGDRRRQELNAALEVMRDPDRRAAMEVSSYLLPLDPSQALPMPDVLARELLPFSAQAPADPAAALTPPDPAELAAGAMAALPEAPWPDEDEMLTQLTARLALEMANPWRAA